MRNLELMHDSEIHELKVEPEALSPEAVNEIFEELVEDMEAEAIQCPEKMQNTPEGKDDGCSDYLTEGRPRGS